MPILKDLILDWVDVEIVSITVDVRLFLSPVDDLVISQLGALGYLTLPPAYGPVEIR